MTEKGFFAHIRPGVQGGVSIGLLIVFTAGMCRRIEPFASWYYAFAWWPFIFLTDALVRRLQGRSLLTRNPREFLFLAVVSIPLWLTFEVWNLVMKNWYYACAPDAAWLRRVGYCISYATVLPAIFEASELVYAVGLFRDMRVKPLDVRKGLLNGLVFAGIACLVLPLIVPKFTFPLIWVGFTFLLEPFNYRYSEASLLRQWERGSMGMLVRLLVGGMLCGLVWEAFNIRALTKWVYTVPFFEELKLFEMPLAGFLGFPPFAVECYVIVCFIGTFRTSRGREPDRDVVKAAFRVPKGAVAAAVVFFTIGSFFMFRQLDIHTVNSLYPRPSGLAELNLGHVRALEKAGVDRLDHWVFRKNETDRVEMPEEELAVWRKLAFLATIKGLGTENVLLTTNAGVRSVEDLAKADAETLGEKLREIQSKKKYARQPPNDRQVRLWIREAKKAYRKRKNVR